MKPACRKMSHSFHSPYLPEEESEWSCASRSSISCLSIRGRGNGGGPARGGGQQELSRDGSRRITRLNRDQRDGAVSVICTCRYSHKQMFSRKNQLPERLCGLILAKHVRDRGLNPCPASEQGTNTVSVWGFDLLLYGAWILCVKKCKCECSKSLFLVAVQLIQCQGGLKKEINKKYVILSCFGWWCNHDNSETGTV